LSLGYFLTDGVSTVYFEDDMPKFTEIVTKRNFDIVYIRDPFNTAHLTLESIKPRVELMKTSHPGAYFVDHVDDIEGVLIEDKWHQYERWGAWMPKTYLGGRAMGTEGPVIAKKRISARSRDIVFDVRPAELSSDWIVQERLVIDDELRVYLLFGQPVTLASRRRPKQPYQATKVTGLHPLSDEETVFVQEIASSMSGFDLVGLDIAVTPDGLRLIEVNRSPQFRRYNELDGSNLVADFWLAIRRRLDEGL
jgi:glutathione synthase/RimK-type ligase-like ATP-grasp enzyme